MKYLDRWLRCLACCVPVLLAACGTLSSVKVDAPDVEAARFADGNNLQADVDQLAQPMVESGHTPGIVVGLLLPDGSTQFFGYGVTDGEDSPRPDGDTLFAVGSLSKGFLAALIALHVDKGDLSWDDTLETLLPPDTPLSPDARKITLLQLATHTSGLPRQPITPRTLWYFLGFLFTGENFYRHFDLDYTLEYLTHFTTDSSGEQQYSNIGYGLLGYILQRRTGLSLDTLLEKEILTPLGLKCTGYVAEASPCYQFRAHPHAGDQPKFMRRGQPVPDWHFTDLMRGSAAISSTARDLLSFAAAHVRGQERLNTILATNLEVRFPKPDSAAAIAWVVDDVYGEPIAYEVGFVGGYSSYLGIDIRHKTAVVVLQNSFNWDNSLGHRMLVRLRRLDEERKQVDVAPEQTDAVQSRIRPAKVN
jgi:CubicO group peptidase (beta-lactamase class C family)